MSLDHAESCDCSTCRAAKKIRAETDIDPSEYSTQELKAIVIGLDAGLFEATESDDDGEGYYEKTPDGWD
jgi:hypothetical protein